jgi:hypothetical protein
MAIFFLLAFPSCISFPSHLHILFSFQAFPSHLLPFPFHFPITHFFPSGLPDHSCLCSHLSIAFFPTLPSNRYFPSHLPVLPFLPTLTSHTFLPTLPTFASHPLILRLLPAFLSLLRFPPFPPTSSCLPDFFHTFP